MPEAENYHMSDAENGAINCLDPAEAVLVFTAEMKVNKIRF